MAKKKFAKHNPPTLRKDPSVTKLGFDDHFPGYIIETSKFKRLIQVIWSKLMRYFWAFYGFEELCIQWCYNPQPDA